MQQNNNTHLLMQKNDIIDFVKNNYCAFNDCDDLTVCELSDGNINYVYRVFDEKTKKSVIVKQADKLLRTSGRELDVNRIKIEFEMLKLQGETCEKFVPKLYYFSQEMNAIIMEDIGEYENMRHGLQSEHAYPTFAEDISTFMAKTLLLSTDLVLDKGIKKERVKSFINIEMCDITEDLVFTEPYFNYKNRNVITEGLDDFVKKMLYDDEELHFEVSMLRNNFMNNAQALIHGDLHTGSIFVNERGIKIIDSEFAFYGPMGYDIGNVLANLFLSLTNKKFTSGKNDEFITFLETTVKDVFRLTVEKLNSNYEENVTFELYKVEKFKRNYLKSVLADTIGYCGTEIIRRVVGDAKVTEVTSVDDLSQKVSMEKCLVEFGIELIKNRYFVTSESETIAIFDSFYEKYRLN